ncbi:FtsX-like permease family protein [Pedobacter sp. HMF7647]|uniref:FtsX-like permease family protein n=1 Tax=Hufsiella arboris TaxID=2695275 RepID=A0A7K1YA69_9SPHI|nr:ABC transporter permease [Hufsiella arboris]MXV51476.1 FtsX-like permease family protein [Hufsiella arboris]
MLKNHIKSALRNLQRYQYVSLINILGLTVGITCCLLILAFVLDELNYDRFHKNAQNIYRVERTFLNPDNKTISLELGAVAPPFAQLLQNDFKEIKSITSILPGGEATLQYNNKIFNERDFYFTDENLFNVFDVTLLKGNPLTALKEPYSIMLTEESAKKYFGDTDPINKLIKLNQQFTCKVTGVYQALPSNSHWHPELMMSFSTLRDSSIYGAEQLRTNWGNNSFYDYILLPENYNPKNLEAQFPAFIDRHVPDDANKASKWTSISLKKLTDIHLRSHKDSELEENGDIKRVYVFSIIGLLILIIACINYMNLATARSSLRAKEIGVRKVAGASKSELVAQFLSESVLICCFATLLSCVLTWLVLPWLNGIAGKSLTINNLLQAKIILPAIILPFIIGILSGIYPALFLSSFKPVKVLKGLIKTGERTLSMRKVLVVFQFAVSIILIISTVIVFQQLSYIQNKSLGFEKDRVLVISENAGLNNSYQSFKNDLLSNTAIKNVARSSRIPSGRLLDANGSQISNGNTLAPTKADIKYVTADEDFIPAYSVKIKAGRNFKGTDGSDTSSFILNESAVRALGLPSNESAIGKQFKYGDRTGQITGVINDFNFESLHQRILPLVLLNSRVRNDYNRISVKITGDPQTAISHIQNTWKKHLPEVPFEYNFLDDRFSDLYKSEKQQQTIFSLFACIAILIACLGLFGLSAFTITQRIKEIGIRKVLGASVVGIVQLLSIDFLLLVGIAALIAFPITWYAMKNWLSDFAYRIDIAWWVFLAASAIALIIAFATISFQAVKAAIANPVKSLRTE